MGEKKGSKRGTLLWCSGIRGIIVLAIAAVLAGCSQPQKFRYASGNAWGTVYHIKYSGATDLTDSILKVVEEVNMSLSPFQKGSIISRINDGEDVKADAMLREVMHLSQQVCSISGGAFDPTVAPLINLWGFGPKKGDRHTPTPQEIDSALMSVGIRECSIAHDGTVTRKSQQTEFNFSAIAKGYGVDKIAEMLARNGCTDYMVEVGGEIAMAGNGPSGDGWVIQVDAPVDDPAGHHPLTSLRLKDICIATSGNYRNYYTTPEGKVGHTISATDGMPAETDILSATILAQSTALADALATAAMAMPQQEAVAMLDTQPHTNYILVIKRGEETDTLISRGADTLRARH